MNKGTAPCSLSDSLLIHMEDQCLNFPVPAKQLWRVFRKLGAVSKEGQRSLCLSPLSPTMFPLASPPSAASGHLLTAPRPLTSSRWRAQPLDPQPRLSSGVKNYLWEEDWMKVRPYLLIKAQGDCICSRQKGCISGGSGCCQGWASLPRVLSLWYSAGREGDGMGP